MHALTCPVRRRWLRWRLHMPFWRDDKTAQMLGIAQYGCRRCGRDAIEERNRASTPEETPCPGVLADRDGNCTACGKPIIPPETSRS